jgi:glucose/arabinose dehydrogenase
MQRVLLIVCTLVALLGAFAQTPTPADAAGGSKIFLPVVWGDTTIVPPRDEAAQRIQVPAGFEIRIFAQNLNIKPRMMAFGPDGHMYITLMNTGQVARLPDRNRNGVADGVEIVASNLNTPHGLEWYNGALYVAETGSVQRLRDADGNGSLETRTLITNNIPSGGGHSSRTIHFGPDGKMYVSVGSDSNNTPETDPRRAAILRFNPDGSIPADNPFANDVDTRKRPLWASGLRNSVDFLWTPTGQLWANHNGSDGLGDDTPPEEIVIDVQRARSHGWPYCYTPAQGANLPPNQQAEVRDPRVALPGGFTCAQAVPALFTDAAHSAPLGMTQGTTVNMPGGWADDLFVAYHGSWNTNNTANYRDCKVQRVVVENGHPIRSETFAAGWRPADTKCGAAETWGRPADMQFGADGAMYISDDKGNRVYRVVYTGN